VRKAKLPDAANIFELVNSLSGDGTLLRRSYAEICENVRDFTVAQSEGGVFLGCGALHLYGPHLAEVRSIVVKPEAKGQVALPSPLYSGAAAIHMGALHASPAIGADFYEKLARNGAVALRGNGAVLNAVAGGQKMYGIIVEFMALNARAKGSPVDFVFPAEGVSIVTEPTAILRGTKNPEAARAFVDFLLSKDGQELAVSQGYFPARKDVKPPPGFPDVASLKILPVDIAELEKRDELNKKRFAELFGG